MLFSKHFHLILEKCQLLTYDFILFFDFILIINKTLFWYYFDVFLVQLVKKYYFILKLLRLESYDFFANMTILEKLTIFSYFDFSRTTLL